MGRQYQHFLKMNTARSPMIGRGAADHSLREKVTAGY
jgi:hypothetical protein